MEASVVVSSIAVSVQLMVVLLLPTFATQRPRWISMNGPKFDLSLTKAYRPSSLYPGVGRPASAKKADSAAAMHFNAAFIHATPWRRDSHRRNNELDYAAAVY